MTPHQLADALQQRADDFPKACGIMVDTDLLRSAAAALRGLEAVRVAAAAVTESAWVNTQSWDCVDWQSLESLRAALAAVEVSS